MPKPENVIGKGFDKRPENINRDGKHRRLIATVNKELEDNGYKEATRAEITGCFLRLIQLSMPKLIAESSDKNNPAMVRIVAKAILSGKGFEVIEKILDRTLGKSIQPIALQGATKHIITFEDFGEGNLEME